MGDKRLPRAASWVIAVTLYPAVAPTVFGQTSGATQKPSPPAKQWKLDVSASDPIMITLKAENAPLEQVARALADQLGAPVVLSPTMKKLNWLCANWRHRGTLITS